MFFDKIKRLFIVDENDPLKQALEQKAQQEVAQNKENNNEDQAPINIESQSVQQPSNRILSEGKVTDKFMDILLGSMNNANMEGFDYLEYKEALQSLGNMQMDEAMRYQSAFAMAKTMGTTPEHLLQTANHYLNGLAQEEQKFRKALENQKATQIGDRHTKIEQLNKVIADKEKRIEQLQAEITKHRENAGVIKQEIDEATVKVENTKNNFFVTYKVLTGQIQNDIEKMKQYLK